MPELFIEDMDIDNDDTVGSQASFNVEAQEALRKFIEEYELCPELWNPTHPMYVKKAVRNCALDRLIPYLVQLKPGATRREDVKRKINSLRTNFRKELKKIAASKRSGKSADEVYTPTSWVFHALSFLEKFEQPAKLCMAEAAVDQELEQQVDDGEDEEVVGHGEVTPSTSSINPLPFPRSYRKSKARSVGPLAKQNILLQKACSLLECSVIQDANIPSIAKAWGEKLLSLDPTQRAFAEKAIGDILFEAGMGTLNRDSVQINVGQQPQNVTTLLQQSPFQSSAIYNNSQLQCTPPSVTPQQEKQRNVTSLSNFFKTFPVE